MDSIRPNLKAIHSAGPGNVRFHQRSIFTLVFKNLTLVVEIRKLFKIVEII